MEEVFHFIHISDLHFQDSTVLEKLKQGGGLREITSKYPSIECLVVSGDLFHQGKLSKDAYDNLKSFLQSFSAKKIILVPGNHDLDRFVRQKKNSGYNEYQTRREAVDGIRQKIERNPNEEIFMSHVSELLNKEAFGGFEEFQNNLKKEITTIQGIPISQDKEYHIEKISYGQYTVRVVMLNTALLAGQSIRGKEYQKRIQKEEEGKGKFQKEGKYREAAKTEMKIASLREAFRDFGEIIVDEESVDYEKGGEQKFCGRMALSKETLEQLKENLQELDEGGNIFTVFVGHHSLDMLSALTQNTVMELMRRCGAKLYLCGHAHQAGYKRYVTAGNWRGDIYQFQAGGFFEDSSGYSQYSFNYGCLSDDGQLKITMHYAVKSPSGEVVWKEESGPCLELKFKVVNARYGNVRQTEDEGLKRGNRRRDDI